MTSELPESADHGDFEPRSYIRIADLVRRKIEDGELKPGDTVRVASLAEEFGVTRPTVGRGLGLLVEEGRLKRWPGHGYIIQARQPAGLAHEMWDGAEGEPALTEREKVLVGVIGARVKPLLEEVTARQERLIHAVTGLEKELERAIPMLDAILAQQRTAGPEISRPAQEAE
jgi:DNA-binding transcriptional regulator YhcF (GntR family)